MKFDCPINVANEELDGSAVGALQRAIAEVKQGLSVIGWVTNMYLKLLRASEVTLSRWSRICSR
jgi:hypothetical protein